MTNGPLAGIRVLDFTHVVAGPFATLHLSDLGADVVKVEPPTGDIIRITRSTAVPNETAGFQALNRGKRSIIVDLHTERGREVIHRLAQNYDVAVVNFRPGVAKALGVDYATLKQFAPALIYAEATAFGRTGPSAELPGGDVTVQGYSGLMALGGRVDDSGSPQAIPGAPLDHVTGFIVAMGICAALYHRVLTGEGQYVGTSMLRAALSLQDLNFARVPRIDGAEHEQTMERLRRGRKAGLDYRALLGKVPDRVPERIKLYFRGYNAKDGGFILGANTPANREQIREVLGIEHDPTASADFDQLDAAEQRTQLDAMEQRIASILRSRTVAEWVAVFREAGAPCSGVNFAEELAEDPEFNELGLLVDLEHDLCGPTRMVGPVLEMSRTPTSVQSASPPLGVHTDEVLRDAGFTTAEIGELRQERVIP
jgi:formyl-CoA transferase